MTLPHSYAAALLLTILSMICWGSWANMQKLAGKWRFELYYFDYTYAWVTPRYGWDSHGYHQCDLGYGVGYDVKVVDCGQRGNMSGNVVVPDTFRVHVIWRGLPIYKTYTMTRNLGANGVIS